MLWKVLRFQNECCLLFFAQVPSSKMESMTSHIILCLQPVHDVACNDRWHLSRVCGDLPEPIGRWCFWGGLHFRKGCAVSSTTMRTWPAALASGKGVILAVTLMSWNPVFMQLQTFLPMLIIAEFENFFVHVYFPLLKKEGMALKPMPAA